MRMCDLARIEACRALFAETGPEIVVHTAGHPFAARDLERVIPTFNDNLATTVNILTCAAESGKTRVVLAGSLEEPGPGEAGAAISSPYAMSKWAASGYARMFHSLYSLPVVVARLFMVYGPGQRDPKKLIPSVIASLLRGHAPRASSGERPVDWIFIDDVVSGLLALAQAPGVEGKTVDIGTGVLTTVRGVVETLAEIIPGAPAPEFGSVPSRRDEQVRAARAEETRATIGWSARVALRDGLARTVEWFRAGAGGAS
jgi:UDP-glucose 4-epimerase